jgi:hypothetical protein
MANKRVFYGAEQAAIGGLSATSFGAAQTIYGLQSVGINTRFNLEQVFELGQSGIYQNIEALPAVEITLEKCLDGKALIYHLATVGAPSGTIQGRANIRSSFAMSIFSDQQDCASGLPLSQVYCSGTYVSSVSLQFPVDGRFREAVTLVGNDKLWITATGSMTYPGQFTGIDNDKPANFPPIGVAQRWHVVFGNTAQPGGTGQFTVNPCVLPLDVDGIDPATGFNLPASDGNGYSAHIQSLRVTVNFGRDELHELGLKGPYWRYVNHPVEVRCDIEVITTRGDMNSATQAGVLGNGNNIAERPIFIGTKEGTKVNLGNRNMLQTTSLGGGNAGARGGNATVTYSFVNFGDFIVQHPADPTVALAG